MKKEKLVKIEPMIDLEVNSSAKTISISYLNVTNAKISYYPIDLEILFSKSPFLTTDLVSTDEFSFVQPFMQENVQLLAYQTF
jgi:hypothetical protein